VRSIVDRLLALVRKSELVAVDMVALGFLEFGHDYLRLNKRFGAESAS
jgi:hypothetical protein